MRKNNTAKKFVAKIAKILEIACEECDLEGQQSYSVMDCLHIHVNCPVTTNLGKPTSINIDVKINEKKRTQEIEVWHHTNEKLKLYKCSLYTLIDSLMQAKNNIAVCK